MTIVIFEPKETLNRVLSRALRLALGEEHEIRSMTSEESVRLECLDAEKLSVDVVFVSFNPVSGQYSRLARSIKKEFPETKVLLLSTLAVKDDTGGIVIDWGLDGLVDLQDFSPPEAIREYLQNILKLEL